MSWVQNANKFECRARMLILDKHRRKFEYVDLGRFQASGRRKSTLKYSMLKIAVGSGRSYFARLSYKPTSPQLSQKQRNQREKERIIHKVKRLEYRGR